MFPNTDEPLDLVDPTGHYIVPPPNAGASERIGNGVSSPSNFVADVATARVVEHAVITAPNNAAKAAAAHAALARVEAEQATAHRAAVAAAQAEARRQAAARAAAARNQVKKKPASSTNNGYSGCVRFGCTDATAVKDDSPGQETPGGWQGFLGGIGSFIIGTAESAACSGIGELSCQAYRDAGGEMPSTLYKNWLSSQGVDTSFNSTYGAGEVTAGIALFAIGAGEADAEDLAAACAGGESFTPGTPVLLADRKSIPISDLKPGDQVLATNTKTGKTSPETVAAVLVHHDTDLYNLTIRSNGRTEVIHTTSNHLFWDPYPHYWVSANKLSKGEHLETPDGTIATADGGTTPRVHEGWKWDLTVPGNNDHDFYVLAGSPQSRQSHADEYMPPVEILVHNNTPCTPAYDHSIGSKAQRRLPKRLDFNNRTENSGARRRDTQASRA